MTVKRWFVVRRGMGDVHSFEYNSQDPKIKATKKGEYSSPVVYSCEAPPITLSSAIALYKSGVRVPVPKNDGKAKKLKPLAEILRIKRENRKSGQGFVQVDTALFYEDEDDQKGP